MRSHKISCSTRLTYTAILGLEGFQEGEGGGMEIMRVSALEPLSGQPNSCTSRFIVAVLSMVSRCVSAHRLHNQAILR